MTAIQTGNSEKRLGLYCLLFILVLLFFSSSLGQVNNSDASLEVFENPYDRPKNGPPLTNVIHKTTKLWLYNWLKAPEKHDPKVKMPNPELDDNEIEAVIAYLASIADQDFPQITWEPFLLKMEDDMTDEEWGKMDDLYNQGRGIWSKARCTICHSADGRGGFVKLGVAFDLSKVIGKINRDWLYHWIKAPKEYFPETLMPRFRYSDGELRALVEYMLRDDSFNYIEEEAEEEVEKEVGAEDTLVVDTALIEEGKRVIELSRCVVCHDIKGIEDILPVDRIRVSPSDEFTELLDDVKCLACHAIQGKGGDYAPDLTQVGSKLKMEWIEKFLQTPDMIRPLSQQMPKFNLTEDEAKIAARYIKENFVRQELIMDALIDETRAQDKIDHGRSLFYQKGCLSCHQIDSEGGALSPGLSNIRDRLEPEYIFFHLKGPHQANPYAVEPDYGLTDEEALALTYFLLALEKGDIK